MVGDGVSGYSLSLKCSDHILFYDFLSALLIVFLSSFAAVGIYFAIVPFQKCSCNDDLEMKAFDSEMALLSAQTYG